MPRFSDRWMAISPASVPDYRLLWKIVLPLIVVLVIVGCWALLLAREIRSRRRAETSLRTAQEDLKKINTELEARVRQRTQDLEKALNDVSESQKRFSAIAENSPDAIMITDSTTNVLYCNSAAERMFGYEREQFIGRPATAFCRSGCTPGKPKAGVSILRPKSPTSSAPLLNHGPCAKTARSFPLNFRSSAGRQTTASSSAP